MRRNVVITGVGTACALGVGAPALWEGLNAQRSGLKPATRVNSPEFRSRLAGEVAGLSAKDALPKSYRKAIKVMARDIELAIVATRAALDDAGLVTRNGAPDADAAPTGSSTYPGPRMGCHIGAGLISAEADELAGALVTATDESGTFSLKEWGYAADPAGHVGRGGMNNLPPLWMLKYLPNMLACHVTILHGAEGPSNTITCAEASGLLSLGESVRVIQRDAADMCFTGGAESKLNVMGYLRMGMAGRLADSGTEEDGAKLVRPYDPDATGSVLGEAGGILIVEEETAARSRGAKIYAVVAGVGSSQTPRLEFEPRKGPDQGLRDAIEAALADAGVDASEIDAIVPQAAATPELDLAEAGAFREIFGRHLPNIEIVTLSPNIGECMAGNAGVMCVAAAMSLHTQMLPGRIHHGKPVDHIRAASVGPRPTKLGHVLVCSSSLGGQAAAVVLRAAV